MSLGPIAVAVGGASGRMGRAVCAAILGAPDLALAGGCGPVGGSLTGTDLGRLAGCESAGVPLREDAALASANAQIWVDFSTPGALFANLARLPAQVRAVVVGVTGLDAPALAAVRDCAAGRALVLSGNFSLGLNVLLGLVRQSAARLGNAWDIEILEHHHRDKRDAPSGTALMLGEAAADGRGRALADVRIGPHGPASGARSLGGIGFASLRGGGAIGTHEVLFAGQKESLTLGHSAQDRTVFADGALAAARWTLGRPAGLYSMQDVLGFNPA